MFNVEKFINSFRYALQGLYYSFSHDQNIRVHIVISFLVILFALVLGLTKLELFAVVIMITLVISAEMINTAIEEVVNLLVNEKRIEAKIAKDVSAGMVLFVSIVAVVVGILVFTPHLLSLFG